MALTLLILQVSEPAEPSADIWARRFEGAVIFCATLLFIFVILFTVAPIIIARDGVWDGNTFKYLRPKLAFSTSLGPMDSGKVFSFRFPDAPPLSLLEYEIEFDQPEAFQLTPVTIGWNAAGVSTLSSLAFTPHRPNSGTVMMNTRRELYLAALTQPNRGPYTVNVLVRGWTHR